MTFKRNIFLYFKVRSKEHKHTIFQLILCVSLRKLSVTPLLGSSGMCFWDQASVLTVALFCVPTCFILVLFPPEYLGWEIPACLVCVRVCGFRSSEGIWASSVPGQQRRPTSGQQEHSQWKEGSDYPPWHLLTHIWNTASSFGPPDTGNALTNWSELSGGTTDGGWWGNWQERFPVRRGWGNWAYSTRGREGLQRI